ncbi:hypothetical protein Bbelb_392750 [Branchiostoma belcheri]|nr:hypothetical protein Bbelb_392750 [Branchiostoma belcheri]
MTFKGDNGASIPLHCEGIGQVFLLEAGTAAIGQNFDGFSRWVTPTSDGNGPAQVRINLDQWSHTGGKLPVPLGERTDGDSAAFRLRTAVIDEQDSLRSSSPFFRRGQACFRLVHLDTSAMLLPTRGKSIAQGWHVQRQRRLRHPASGFTTFGYQDSFICLCPPHLAATCQYLTPGRAWLTNEPGTKTWEGPNPPEQAAVYRYNRTYSLRNGGGFRRPTGGTLAARFHKKSGRRSPDLRHVPGNT